MAGTSGKPKIYRNTLQEIKSNSVVVGGADTSDLPSKQAIIDEKIASAMEKTREECQSMIDEAKTEAKNIVNAAQEQAAEVEKNAFATGLENGRQEGNRQINAELKAVLEDARKILDKLEKEREECLEDEENRVLKIITQISKKLLKRDLSINPEMSLEFIKSGISSLSHRSIVNISVNPETASKLNEIREEILTNNPGIESLNISSAKHLDHGDLVLESNRERLDLRLDSQLEELLKNMTGKDS